jgi:tetratricopeptide (TPR) repeat protein
MIHASGPLRRVTFGIALTLLVAPAIGAGGGGGGGRESSGPDVGAELVAAQKLIEAKDWSGAIVALERAQRRNDRDADVHNLLGYSLRHAGRLQEAFAQYDRALHLDPWHRGAHEYAGEAWLQAKEPAKAREHLAALRKLCGTECEPYRDLAQAIADYERGTPAR